MVGVSLFDLSERVGEVVDENELASRFISVGGVFSLNSSVETPLEHLACIIFASHSSSSSAAISSP